MPPYLLTFRAAALLFIAFGGCLAAVYYFFGATLFINVRDHPVLVYYSPEPPRRCRPVVVYYSPMPACCCLLLSEAALLLFIAFSGPPR